MFSLPKAATAIGFSFPLIAHSMTMTASPGSGSLMVISLEGPISTGDAEKFRSLVTSFKEGQGFLAIFLNSDGGSVTEAEKLAGLVRLSNLKVAILSGSRCASACFLVFAAAKNRFASPDALIGVHGAAESDGSETLMTMGATTAVGRDLAGYGVPEEIIGRMVETEPGKIAWLSGAELAAMGVTFLPMPSKPPPAAPVVSPAPDVVASLPPATSPKPTFVPDDEFKIGLADRNTWEKWFSTQSGKFRDGAEYWTGQRSLKKPGSCSEPSEAPTVGWTAGCLAAKALLTPFDQMRRTSPQFKAGWNSLLSQTTQPSITQAQP